MLRTVSRLTPALVSLIALCLIAVGVSGQVFVVWGTRVHLMEGFTLANTLDRGEGRWTPQEIAARKDELFAGRRSKVPPMGFGQ